MKQHSLLVRLLSVFFAAMLTLASCKKVNMATELGSDLIPVVDNINTFDTVLSVSAFNYPFSTEDSSRSLSSYTQFLGTISSDPLFGTTQATMFLQLKSATYPSPFAFTNPDSLIALDSAVLVLGYNTVYGDSLAPQQVQVFEVSQSSPFRFDSLYMIRENTFTYPTALSAVQTFVPANLNDSVKMFREAAANQLRIRLNSDFGRRLLRYDSTNAYRTDSAFNSYFKGFAIRPSGSGNALVGFSLADTNTKLALYYRYRKAGQPDTTVTYFRFNPLSASANHIQRNRAGSAFAAVAGDEVADPLVYLQNTPGTYAKVRIPGLAGLTNRIVHRAELIVEQVPDVLSKTFTPPAYLYLDAFDVTKNVYRTIPLDVTFGSNGQVNAAAFGMTPFAATDASGAAISQWRLNLTRYVQNVVNKTIPAYEFRLFAPFVTRTLLGTTTTEQTIGVNPYYGAGRVRVGGGNHPTQPLRLRIVYSRL